MLRDPNGKNLTCSGSHLDLRRAPYVLHGVKYIDPVSLAHFSGKNPLVKIIGEPFTLYYKFITNETKLKWLARDTWIRDVF